MAGDTGHAALGSLEAKIMDVMWKGAGEFVLVREVQALLPGDPAYTTVMTVMSRLYDKGLLRRRRSGRAWSYRPALSREAFVASTMADALDVANDRRAALLHFVADLRPEEADALRRLLADEG